MTTKTSKTIDELTAKQKEHIVRLFLQGEPIASSTTIAPSVIEDVIRDAFGRTLVLFQDTANNLAQLQRALEDADKLNIIHVAHLDEDEGD